MKIRTKLYLSAALSIGLMIILALLLILFSFKVNEELKKETLANEFARAITGLLILTDKYLAHQAVRTEQQLDLKLTDIEEIIKSSEGFIPLEIIRNAFASLNESFSYIKANYRERKELLKKNASREEIDRIDYLEERLTSIMRSNAQKILAISFRISSEAREETNNIQKRGNLLVSVFAILLVLIIGTSTLLITKSITEPIKRLVRGANLIRRGNSEHRIDITSRDETGDLSQAFNEMVEQLNQHRDHLEELVKERTRELEEKTVEVEQATRHKSQFLANMSHELRTPLNSIIGFTGIILQGIVGELNDEQKKQLNMVYDSAKHLLGLINDILDLSKIEAGKIEIIPAQFEVKELLQTVEKMVSPMIEEKDLTLEVAISEEVPQTIYNDKNRIKQVLINLLSNATKFTESGEISLALRTSMLDPGSSLEDFKKEELSSIQHPVSGIVFSVSDTGIGIKPEHLPDIFDEFKQIEGPLKEKPAGTGLGLAISRKIVEMMGGRIWAESEYGKGAHFQFAIPIREITKAKKPPIILPEALDLSKKLVLTIDDEVEAQEILKTYLKSEGYEVIQAYNSMEAMELAKKFHPFAITLDIIMPGKDGWDILHELKKDPQTEGIPVICISILDNREMGLSLGAIEYMVKPIKKAQLMEELQRLEKRFRIYDILVVDDEPQAVELLAQYLNEADNYTVSKAYGGQEALSRVKKSRPDLIILDLMMPEVDGFEVIRHLKRSEETKDIPIIIVSAKKLTQEEIEYLNNNIEKIIRKGHFSREELLKDIKRALEKI